MIVFRKSKLFADNDVNNEKKNDNSGLVLGLGLAGSGVLGVGSVIGANRYINNGKVRIQEEYNKNIEDLINRDKKQAKDFIRLEKDIVDNYNDKKKKLNGLINDNEYLIDSATDKKTKKELYETENYYYNRLKDEKKNIKMRQKISNIIKQIGKKIIKFMKIDIKNNLKMILKNS